MALRGIGVRDILVLGNGPTERDALQASLAAHLGPPMGARAFGWEGLQVKSVAALGLRPGRLWLTRQWALLVLLRRAQRRGVDVMWLDADIVMLAPPYSVCLVPARFDVVCVPVDGQAARGRIDGLMAG